MNDEYLGWDCTITKDSGGFNQLPEGDYDFVIDSFEKGTCSKASKTPGANQAVLTLIVDDGNGNCNKFKDYISLTKSMEWKLGSMLVSVGLKKRGETIEHPDWNALPGRHGKAHIVTDEYMGKNGTVQTNRVKRYLDWDSDAPQDGFTPLDDIVEEELPFK